MTQPDTHILPGNAITRISATDAFGTDKNLVRAVQLARHMGERTQISIAEAQDIVHPGGTSDAKNKALQRVITAVAACTGDIRLDTTGARQLGGDRRIGFTARLTNESRPNLPELRAVGDRYVNGQPATVSVDGKPVVQVFLSSCDADRERADQLWQALKSVTDIDATYRFMFWNHDNIRAGADRHDEIKAAIERSDLAVHTVSKRFLANHDLIESELLPFLHRNRAIPVLLETFDLDRVDVGHLVGREIYGRGQAFDTVVDDRVVMNRWVERLRDQIHQAVEHPSRTDDSLCEPQRIASARLPDFDATPYLAPSYGHPTRLPGTFYATESVAPAGSRVDAIDYLLDWSRSDGDRKRAPVAAVLGEYGTGKTISCQRLAQAITQRRAAGEESLPEALYFDLRNLSKLRDRSRVPTVEEVLQECIDRGWSPGDSGRPSAEDVLRRADQVPTLFIIDGLDEALVHLTAGDGKTFTRELLSLRTDRFDRQSVRKLLLSCRTHYFRTVSEQYGSFVSQHRDGAEAADFEALLLLPFDADQVRAYLTRAVPDGDAARAYEMLTAVHDLSDLISRPVTLKLVVQQIAYIERRVLAGEPVYATEIYARIADDWIERDNGKGKFRAGDKLMLASGLAAWMWRQGARTVELDSIENWLHTQVGDNPRLVRYKSIDPELLEEELRTATFLVRQDSDDGSRTRGFRFAHTSFQEYFLARHLLEAVALNLPDEWATDPSDETLGFLAELFALRPDRADLLAVLSSWGSTYRPPCSELLLRFGMRVAADGNPVPFLAGIDLSGAALTGWRLIGTQAVALNLAGARLRGTDLRNTRLDFVDLSGADLGAARCDRAVLHRCRLDNADMTDTCLRGAFLHECAFDPAGLVAADTFKTRIVRESNQ
ncbi:NACHT domain-containing protein [Nocardia sp. NPDC127606]|uniref:NACHT domain-containing protein n=1 Tax=Nocardia sp. NPDC127606 TaxID=3345406 RepID=UPI003625D4D8